MNVVAIDTFTEKTSQLTNSYERPYAGKRFFAASLYDMALAFWIALTITTVLSFCSGGGEPPLQLVQLVAMAVFLCRDFRGMALGKYLLGIRVVDFNTGEPASMLQSLKRNSVLIAPFILYETMVYLPVAFNLSLIEAVKWGGCFITLGLMIAELNLVWKGNGRRIADHFAGTVVVNRTCNLKAN